MSSSTFMKNVGGECSEELTGEDEPASGLESFFTDILKPGSSLHPTFQAILDGCFAGLFVVLSFLAFLTSGNIHLFALIVIELCLWASVKWFVNELKKTPPSNEGERAQAQQKEE